MADSSHLTDRPLGADPDTCMELAVPAQAVSRGLSRVEAGNPRFPRLVQVTSGGFSWWL